LGGGLYNGNLRRLRKNLGHIRIMGQKVDKTFEIFGKGKETTKDIAKRSMKIAGTGIMLGLAGFGLGHSMGVINS